MRVDRAALAGVYLALRSKPARELARTGAVDSVFLYPFHDDPRSRTFRDARRVPPVLLGTFALTRLGRLLHQQMIPRHSLAQDRANLVSVMSLRKEAGSAYRGY
jgi:hypothetical protein